MIASRILSVCAAIALVAAFALATLLPPLMPLGQALVDTDHHLIADLHAAAASNLPASFWTDIAAPCLERPAWLLPAMLGIVLCGLALSTRPRRSPQKRRRSN
jgi:hypothetical protein